MGGLAVRKKNHPDFIVVDLFCGAGGVTAGFDRAIVGKRIVAQVIACINHSPTAIRSHARNFPNCIHFTEDIRNMDMVRLCYIVEKYRRKYPLAKLILWASCECTNFSNAKGGSRDADSRTLSLALYPYIHALRPELIMVENIREIMSWGPLIEKVVKAVDGDYQPPKYRAKKSDTGAEYCPIKFDKNKKCMVGHFYPESRKKGIDYVKWRQTIEGFGYRYSSRLLNSADYGSYQARLRYFAVFAGPGMPITFPIKTHDKHGKHGLPKWKAVRDVLNLDKVGEDIFGRPKPLSPKTLERVMAGLIKFVANGQPEYLVKNYSGDPDSKAVSLDKPGPTITTVPHESLVTVCMVRSNGGEPQDRVSDLDSPALTLTTSPNQQLVSMIQYNGKPENSVFSPNGPCHTITTKDRFAGVWIDNRTLNGRPTSVDQPAPTLVTEPTQQMVTAWMHHDNRNGDPTPVDEPAKTIVTEPRQQIVTAFLDNQYGCEGEARGSSSLNAPCPTLTVVPKKALVSAFLDRQFGESQGASIDEPCGALLAEPKTNLVSAQFVMPTHYDNGPQSLDEPSSTLTANRKWNYLVTPWLMANMHDNAGSSLNQPCPTLLTGTHHYLMNPQYVSAGGSVDAPCFVLIARMDKAPPHLVSVEISDAQRPVYGVTAEFFKDKTVDVETRIRVFMAVYGISKICMRMLFIVELKRIQGLNVEGLPDYILEGTKAEQKKAIGNAVVPVVVTEWILAFVHEIKNKNIQPQLLMI